MFQTSVIKNNRGQFGYSVIFRFLEQPLLESYSQRQVGDPCQPTRWCVKIQTSLRPNRPNSVRCANAQQQLSTSTVIVFTSLSAHSQSIGATTSPLARDVLYEEDQPGFRSNQRTEFSMKSNRRQTKGSSILDLVHLSEGTRFLALPRVYASFVGRPINSIQPTEYLEHLSLHQ